MTSRGHVPHRTCAGCGAVAPKRSLVRLALEPGGRAVLDPPQRRSGRGAYVHRDPGCLERATRRGGLARAFRARVLEAPAPTAVGPTINH